MSWNQERLSFVQAALAAAVIWVLINYSVDILLTNYIMFHQADSEYCPPILASLHPLALFSLICGLGSDF